MKTIGCYIENAGYGYSTQMYGMDVFFGDFEVGLKDFFFQFDVLKGVPFKM